MAELIRVPVLIVGGGGCGLSASIFLSNLGVESLLVERHAQPSPMPKARYLNQRTMEMFRQHGVADAIYARSMPGKHIGKMRWATSLGGDGAFDRKTLYEMDSFGGSGRDADYLADSPCESTLYPQVRLEPLLREIAAARPPGRLWFNHELMDLVQSTESVVATVLDRATNTSITIEADYVIAADAGKTVGPIVGAQLEGTPELVDMVTVYFGADLSRYIDDDHVMTYWLANPEGDTTSWGAGVLGKLGPKHFDRHSEEWMFHFSFRPGDPARFDEASLVPRIRDLLKVPELELQILGVGHWIVQGVLADWFRFGRVFLAGDAAHRHTPTTGLGLNAAIHDSHNLAWKIALVQRAHATDALLDSYESERRPVGKRNVEWALFTFSNHALTGAAIGIVPGDPERSRANFSALLAAGDDGVARRHRFNEVMKLHRTEFQAHDLEIGFRYDEGALVPDGTPAPERDPTGRKYLPTTRPGHRLPHAWVEREGVRISTLDLVRRDAFLLITGSRESAWYQAAGALAATYATLLDILAIGGDGCDVIDAEGTWRRLRGVGRLGAILVRPDNHVAWRSIEVSADAEGLLRRVIARVLCGQMSD